MSVVPNGTLTVMVVRLARVERDGLWCLAFDLDREHHGFDRQRGCREVDRHVGAGGR